MLLHLDIRNNMGVLKMLEGVPIYLEEKKPLQPISLFFYELFFKSYFRYPNKNKFLLKKNRSIPKISEAVERDNMAPMRGS